MVNHGRHFYVSVERGAESGYVESGDRRGIKFSKLLRPNLELFKKDLNMLRIFQILLKIVKNCDLFPWNI